MKPTLPNRQAWHKERYAGDMTTRMPMRSAICRSTPIEVGRLGQIFGLCGGPYAHTIHHHSHNHKIKGTPFSCKKCSLLRWREHSRLSGHDTLLRLREHSRVSGQDTSHKWMRCWRHSLRLCPILAKWSHCGASQYSCPKSLMITQRQTKIPHIIWMWYCLLIADQVIINCLFLWYDYIYLNSHVAECLGLDMIRSYCLLTIFVLSFANPTEIVVQFPDH